VEGRPTPPRIGPRGPTGPGSDACRAAPPRRVPAPPPGRRRNYDSVVLLGPWGRRSLTTTDAEGRQQEPPPAAWSRAEAQGASVRPDDVAAFFDQGGNVVVTGSTLDDPFDEDVLAALGMRLVPGVVSDAESNAATRLGASSAAPVVTSRVADFLGWEGAGGPVVYHGGALLLAEGGDTVPLVWGEPSARAGAGPAPRGGRPVVLVGGLQGRHGPRAVGVGTHSLLRGDSLHPKQGNPELVARALEWGLRESCVLRWGPLRHAVLARPGVAGFAPEAAPARYRVGDRARVDLRVEARGAAGAGWAGLAVPPGADPPLLTVSLADPFLEVPMETDGAGNFWAEFDVPERYGAYKQAATARVPGYGTLDAIRVTTARPWLRGESPAVGPGAALYFVAAGVAAVAGVALGASLAREGARGRRAGPG